MTFLALLTKEMRLRMRRERTIWVIVAYILLMGLLGWFVINSSSHSSNNGVNNWTSIGYLLYALLAIVQMFLILFITPAFTATAVNGEKERQTFDLLLCSRLSAFSLISGKLLAGLMNSLLLIAASIPLFSLVFFFGGVSPLQAEQALAVSIATAVFAATLGIFCSALFQRPAVSTAITYMAILLWMILPLILASMTPTQSFQTSIISSQPTQEPPPPFVLMWNPLVALSTTYNAPYFSFPRGNYTFHALGIAPWQAYILLDICATLVLFFASVWFVKPRNILNLQTFGKKDAPVKQETKATVTA
jgi:ABC-type transport system involved in multi-copper enzyme maturation permease subunit